MLTLIIDDNATNRRILSELTRQWKMKPHMCDSGETGFAELSRAASEGSPYRLLLLDERCPGWMEWKCSTTFGGILCCKV